MQRVTPSAETVKKHDREFSPQFNVGSCQTTVIMSDFIFDQTGMHFDDQYTPMLIHCELNI
jgi:hypothetical protein